MRYRCALAALIVGLFGRYALGEGIEQAFDRMNLTDQQRQQISQRINQARQQQQKQQQDTDKKAQQKLKEDQKLTATLIKELFGKAEAAFKEGNYSAAGNYYTSVSTATVPGTEQMAAQAKMKLEEIERLAEQKYQEAELLLLQGDYAAAAEAFSSIVTTFPFTETAKKADVKLRILRTTPKAAAAVLYADAMAEISAENYPAAVKLLRQIVEKYPDEVAALKARTKLQELEKSTDVQASLKADSNLRADKVCPKWVSMAKNYVMNNQKDRAREYLLRVVAEFPESTYADEAVKMLAEL